MHSIALYIALYKYSNLYSIIISVLTYVRLTEALYGSLTKQLIVCLSIMKARHREP